MKINLLLVNKYWVHSIMKKINFIKIINSLLLIVLIGCGSINTQSKSQSHIPSFSPDLLKLASWMEGSFSSYEQSLIDTNYFSINLEMHRIWGERTDAIWLYVEQAVSKRIESPYRQRVYKVTQQGDNFISEVFELENAKDYVGLYNDKTVFKMISPTDLLKREGCAVIMRFTGKSYKGSTKDYDCSSTLYGATYATSEVEIYPNKIISWDRGFNTEHTHIWGSENGPYIFNLK